MDEGAVLSARFAFRDLSAGLVVEFSSPPFTVVACEEPDERVCGLIRRLRGPVLVVYSRGSIGQVRRALAAGAAACLPLSFILAAVAARLGPFVGWDGRAEASGVRLTDCGLVVGDREFRLTPAEYRLVQVLWEAGGQVVGHRELEQALYGRSGPSERQAVRQTVHRLRARLGPLGQVVQTEAGFGYRLRRELPPDG